jgi:hypothetical protein
VIGIFSNIRFRKLYWQAVAILTFVSFLSGGCEKSGQATEVAEAIDSGIEGIVLLGPMHPEANGRSSVYSPFAATIIVQDQNRQSLTTVKSKEDGAFRVVLPPGAYWLNPVSPRPGVPPLAHPFKVTVEPHRFTYIKVHYDTGLRRR